jgi:hypothetical protein
MGLTIHYRGLLRDPGLAGALQDEASAIAGLLEWPCHLINDEDIKGIILNPDGCEPLVLCFTARGRLVSPFQNTEPQWIFTKTQYAGVDVHMTIIRLLKYLEEKYFAEFELKDEGEFWETGDEAHLREIWSRYEAAMDAVGLALSQFPAGRDESAGALFARLEAYLRRQLG